MTILKVRDYIISFCSCVVAASVIGSGCDGCKRVPIYTTPKTAFKKDYIGRWVPDREYDWLLPKSFNKAMLNNTYFELKNNGLYRTEGFLVTKTNIGKGKGDGTWKIGKGTGKLWKIQLSWTKVNGIVRAGGGLNLGIAKNGSLFFTLGDPDLGEAILFKKVENKNNPVDSEH